LNPFVVTLRRTPAARSCCLMTDQPAFRNLSTAAGKWRALAEKRRDFFNELYRSGRWRLYYDEYEFRARAREVAALCERWAGIVERHRPCASEREAPAQDRDAA